MAVKTNEEADPTVDAAPIANIKLVNTTVREVFTYICAGE